MKARRQDFSEHKEIWCMAFRVKMNQEVVGQLKTDTPNWSLDSVRTHMKIFLNWLLFETKLLEAHVEWVSGFYTLRLDEIACSEKEGHLETLLILKERQAFAELKGYLCLYVSELLEAKKEVSPQLGWRDSEDLNNLSLECELKTMSFIFLVEKILREDN